MRSEGQCEIKERPPRMHGFDPSQRDQLKTRPKGYKKMSETQKWCHIYIILFPETAIADVPSPCKSPSGALYLLMTNLSQSMNSGVFGIQATLLIQWSNTRLSCVAKCLIVFDNN